MIFHLAISICQCLLSNSGVEGCYTGKLEVATAPTGKEKFCYRTVFYGGKPDADCEYEPSTRFFARATSNKRFYYASAVQLTLPVVVMSKTQDSSLMPFLGLGLYV